MPRNQNCFCFTARTGVIVIAILGIVAEFSIFSVLIGLDRAQLDNMIEQAKQQTMDEFILEGEPDNLPRDYESYWTLLDFLTSNLPWALPMAIAVSIFDLITYECMLYGVTHDKYRMLLPWLIATMSGLVLATIAIVIILCYVDGDWQSVWFWTAITTVPFWALGYYFWFVVQSVYLLKEYDRLRMTESANAQSHVKYV